MLLLQNHRPLCAVALIENGLHMGDGEGRVTVGWGGLGGGFAHKLLLQHHSCPLALGSFALRILFANLVLVDGVATQG